MLTVTYDPAIVYGWLKGKEVFGLDKEASLDRFEGKIRGELTRWAHVDGVHFQRKSNQELIIEPLDDALDIMAGQVQMIFIDCNFLVYKTPEQHFQALKDTDYINLRCSLTTDIAEAYQLSWGEADRLVRVDSQLSDRRSSSRSHSAKSRLQTESADPV